MNNFRPQYFQLHELVPPDIFKERGHRGWELFRPEALAMLDGLRKKFGAITVNNWIDGGQYRESGLRRFDSKTGAEFSMHKYGCGFDPKFAKVMPQEAYAYIKANRSEFPLITAMEDIEFTPTWLHVDTRNIASAEILIVKPK